VRVEHDGMGRSDRRARLVLLGRVLGSIAMFAFLLSRIPRFDVNRFWPGWTTHTIGFLAGAAALSLLGIVLSTLRWQQVLHALGLDQGAGWRRLLSYYLAGQFVGNVLPSTIGGDVLRVSRLAKDNGEAPGTFASVVLERLTGWLVLPVITLVAFLVNPGLRHLGAATQVALGLSIVTLLALCVILVAAANRSLGARLAHHGGWKRFVGAVHLGLDRFRSHPAAAAWVLVVGFAYQLVLVLAALMAAEALGINVGPTALLAFVPAVAIAQVLPIGISGLGVREGAFVLFLTPLGVATEQAIALGLLLYALNLLVSLLGAPAFAIGAKPQRALA
jgi:glycosyltransferase 2 family protein